MSERADHEDLGQRADHEDLGWCVVELLGHRRTAGYVSEQLIAGTSLLRVDTPADAEQAASTQYFGGQAIYCITPTSEETARLVARANRPAPVERWELPAPAAAEDEDEDGDSADEDR